MKKLLVLMLLLITPMIIVAQDLNIPDNVYDKADDYTKSRKAFQRERWFFEQRMYPNNFIPEGAYQKAQDEKAKLRRDNGFFYPSTVSWFNLGPTPGYYFSYGNISSRIVTVKFDPVNPNTIYIGAAYGGVWKSTNSGLNWTSKSDYEISLSSGALAIDPVNPNIIYYGTGEATYSGSSYYGRGLLKSTNGGDTWVNIRAGFVTDTYFSRIVIKPGNSDIVFAAVGTYGLYKSTNAGMNWSQVVSGRCDDIVFSPDGTKAYLIGSGTNYKVSTDGGSTFTAGTFPVAMGSRNHIAICKSVPSVLYVSKYSGTTIEVYKSTNSGLSFSQISVGTDFNGGQAWYDFYMHVNPFNPDVAYVGAVDIWRTTDGNTFVNNTNGYGGGNVHVDEHNMDFHPTDSNVCVAVSDGGIWYSSNKGDTWINRNAGLTLTQFYRMTSDPNNANHLAGGTQDNGTQRTLGTTNWAAAFGGDGGEVCFSPTNTNYILGETQNNGMMRSVNNGAGWSNAASGLTGNGAWVAPIVAHPDSAGVFYTARTQVFKTTNIGATWTAISSGTNGATISQMAISKSDPKIMFVTIGASVFKSTDGGYNFVSSGSGVPNKTITSISIQPNEPKYAILTQSGFGGTKIHRTTNGGTNWFSINGDLPDSPINDGLIYYPGYATNVILAATDVGVFMTNNNGTKWTELADGLPNTVAIHLDYNQASGKIRIGTHGRGVFELSGQLIGITNYNSGVPEKFYLKQNYPNPFNPTTRVSFGVVKSGFVNLKVYDALGREVANLVNENLKSGNYEVTFRGDNLSSGMYFYKLSVNDFTETKRMMLIK